MQSKKERNKLRREYYRRNREHTIKVQKEWTTSHMEKVNEMNKRRRERNYAFIIALKDQPCADCGHKFPHYIMEFDHVHGEKKCTVTSLQGSGITLILKEAEKCDVVCANCHRTRGWVRQQLKNGGKTI